MKFIEIPSIDLIWKSEELVQLGLAPRRSVDGTKAILHIEHYDLIFPRPSLMNLDQNSNEVTYPYPVYDNPSKEFEALLSSKDWVYEEIER